MVLPRLVGLGLAAAAVVAARRRRRDPAPQPSAIMRPKTVADCGLEPTWVCARTVVAPPTRIAVRAVWTAPTNSAAR